MALNTTTLLERARDLSGACPEELTSEQEVRAVRAALRTFSRFQRKVQDAAIVTSPGVDRYACPVADALDILIHSYVFSASVPVITGYEPTVPYPVSDISSAETASISMDIWLSQYEADSLLASVPQRIMYLDGGDVVLSPPPQDARTVWARFKVPYAVADFPSGCLQLEALEYETAVELLKIIYPRRIAVSDITVGPQTVRPGDPRLLKELMQSLHDEFLARVQQFSVAST